MTIIEAIKTGKRFRRPGKIIDANDILADDWYVEEEKISITREEFFRACERVPASFDADEKGYVTTQIERKPELWTSLVEELFGRLAKELGFK